MRKNKPIIFDGWLLKLLIYIGVIGGLFIIEYLLLNVNLYVSLLFSCIPIVLIVFLIFLKKPIYFLIVIFIINYFLLGLGRYMLSFIPGVFMMLLLILLLVILLLYSIKTDPGWKYAKNFIMLMASLWTLYCIWDVFNIKMGSVLLWALSLRAMALYFILFVFFTLVLMHRYKNLKVFLIIWSVLTLLAVFKALFQKYFGFDAAENYWLYVDGKAKTHILNTGIRYFSFFSDAANFGCGMALSFVVFSISAFFVKHKILKIYFLFVSLLALHAMFMSGTRSAIIIPFLGYGIFVILSKNKKVIILSVILMAGTFYFFYGTNHLESVSYVRRMRTAFHPTEDASFMLREENKRKLRRMLADKPFGYGIGSTNASGKDSSQIIRIPPDSGLVKIWIETGIVGLIFYLLIMLMIIGRGSYIIFFKIKDPELKGIEIALLCGFAGILAASYTNDVFMSFPNGPILYMSAAFIFMAEHFDREIEEKKSENFKKDEESI